MHKSVGHRSIPREPAEGLMVTDASAGRHSLRRLLEEASGKTKVQVQELLARRFPRPDVASTIRKLPPPRAAAPTPALPRSAPSPEASAASDGRDERASAAQTASAARSPHKAVAEPLS